jgi:hypothetical protein
MVRDCFYFPRLEGPGRTPSFSIKYAGSSEKAVELPAGGVEDALLVFQAVMDQWPAVLVDYIADELFRRLRFLEKGFVHVANDLSAEQPHIVDVIWEAFHHQVTERFSPAADTEV